MLAQYPVGLVEECCDPRRGLARTREFPPTVAVLVEWMDERLKHHQLIAAHQPRPAPAAAPDFSDEYREGMLARMSKLMHEVFDGKKEKWIRPVGVFETPDDRWNERRRQVPAAGRALESSNSN